MREINQAGLTLIKKWEGILDGDPTTVNLDPYLDPVGIWTIGWGHAITDLNGKFLRGSSTRALARALYPGGITLLQAELLLRADLIDSARDVLALVTVPLTDNQFAALVSFHFNTGALKISSLLKKLNAGDNLGAADQFGRWIKGHVNDVLVILPGLVKRRADERVLFLKEQEQMTDGKLLSGQALKPEETLISPGGHSHLHYQNDGNLVVYLDDKPIWASHTDGHPAGLLKMRADGDMVVQTPDGAGIAHSKTAGHPGAMVQLQDDGNYVIYEDPRGPLAGVAIWASASSEFIHEHVEPEPVPDRPTKPLVGKVDFIDGGRGGVHDANDQRLIVGLHAGDLLAEAFNHGWGKVTQSLDYGASRGFHFFRSWTNLPAPEWWGVAPRPGNFSAANPEHWVVINRFADELLARDLRWLVSQGDLLWFFMTGKWSKQQLFDYMGQLGQLLQAKGGAERLVIGVDAGNEAWNFTRCTDPVLMGAMLDAFLKECPCPIRSMTSATDEGNLNQFDGKPVTITDKHGSRMTVRHAIERSFTTSYWDGKTHPYIIDSEQPGCGPKVSATAHPEEWMEPETMGSIVLVGLMTHQIPVVMSSPGVYLSDETFEQYDAQLSLGPRIAALLPQDVQSWQEFHGGEGRSFSPDRILAVSGNNVRCDHKRGPDNRYGVLVYQDAPGPLSLHAVNGFEGTIMDPGTLQIEPISFSKDATVNLNFRRARFLLGRRTS